MPVRQRRDHSGGDTAPTRLSARQLGPLAAEWIRSLTTWARRFRCRCPSGGSLTGHHAGSAEAPIRQAGPVTEPIDLPAAQARLDDIRVLKTKGEFTVTATSGPMRSSWCSAAR